MLIVMERMVETMKTKDAVKKLERLGIKYISDLDGYDAGTKHGVCDSRYGKLKALVGENAADSMLHELSILQCCGLPKK